MKNNSEIHKGFSGDLSELSIVELVQMLNLNKKSGVLNIKGEKDLLEAIKKCFASLLTNRARAYRQEKGFNHLTISSRLSTIS